MVISNSQENFEGYMPNFVVSSVPADGLALLGTRPTAGTVMTKFVSHTFQTCLKLLKG